MAFCEDCGAPLSAGIQFCENCGAKLSLDSKNLSPASIVEHGILYTNLSLLAKKSNRSQEELSSILNDFVNAAAARGIGYELCDVSSAFSDVSTVKNHLEVIKKIVEKSHPKYLFIIGSSEVIPSMVWENEASDFETDSDVSSDLPYSTLDVQSPFAGVEYDFDNCLKVGRLPESGISLERYFYNLENGCGKTGELKSFALSAAVWKAETEDIYKKLSSDSVQTSPECEKETVANVIPSDTNLFLFNLHGSNSTEFWYGQQESSYPKAMDHNSLSNVSNPYFLMVEACYGAYYSNRTPENSILLSALNGKCISFLGASRIAFGTPSPKGSCADIIAEEHLKNLKNGMSAGESLCAARKVLMEHDSAETVKTLAEFSLYGDPSARMNGMPVAAKGIFAKDTSKSFSKGINIPMPDIRRAIKMELITVDQKIAEAIEEMIYSKYEDFKGIKPKYYKSSRNEDELSAVFKTENEIGSKLVTVKFQKNGQVKNIIESK